MCLMSKEVRINVRTSAQIKADLETTAELRGLTVSALVNSLVVKAIREEKEREPSAFIRINKPPIEQTKEEIKQKYIGGELKKMKPKQLEDRLIESDTNNIETTPQVMDDELAGKKKEAA